MDNTKSNAHATLRCALLLISPNFALSSPHRTPPRAPLGCQRKGYPWKRLGRPETSTHRGRGTVRFRIHREAERGSAPADQRGVRFRLHLSGVGHVKKSKKNSTEGRNEEQERDEAATRHDMRESE
eukprot:CAMPEP_0170169464 /NCGR_PEP_ID=MMETSP0040_2-20121228/2385_1 /TAXON_ID=641309 /ORGANISM="Lotharella oceanica, Strain CCMP622" /LENGTH=125 /DNA_ID=CAMNT_0010408229 /DNA_START=623 /DNA_END=997 /DNA_ORIENTATION=+